MKIWLFNPYGQTPGEGWRDSRFTMLGKALARRGHEVVWWTASFSHTFKVFRANAYSVLSVEDGFKIHLVPTSAYAKNISFGRIRFEISYAMGCFNLARSSASRPDCIVATEPSQIVGFLGVRLGRRFRVPVVLDVFDMWPELFTLVLPRPLKPLSTLIFFPFHILKRYNLRRASGIVSLCKTYLREVMTLVRSSSEIPSLAVFNGIDLTEFRSEMPSAGRAVECAAQMGKRAGETWAVYTGTLGNNYDVRTLVEASAVLSDRRRNISILVLGEGPLRGTITSYIATHPEAKIRYLGPSMKPSALIGLYKACDIALCAYSRDSNVAMPNKAYDYLAAGMPIVSSLRGELEEFLKENDIGIQYEAGNPVSLADALEKLTTDPSARVRMARNAQDKAYLFDSKVLYAQYADFIEGVR